MNGNIKLHPIGISTLHGLLVLAGLVIIGCTQIKKKSEVPMQILTIGQVLDYHKVKYADVIFEALQQNLWVNLGSGKSPSV